MYCVHMLIDVVALNCCKQCRCSSVNKCLLLETQVDSGLTSGWMLMTAHWLVCSTYSSHLQLRCNTYMIIAPELSKSVNVFKYICHVSIREVHLYIGIICVF